MVLWSLNQMTPPAVGIKVIRAAFPGNKKKLFLYIWVLLSIVTHKRYASVLKTGLQVLAVTK